MVKIQNGTLDDFFESATMTAKQIDKNDKISSKHTVWMETEDLRSFLKPSRTIIIEYLRNKSTVEFSELLLNLNKTPTTLNNDLKLLLKYQLIDISNRKNKESTTNNKIIKPLFFNEQLELKVKL